MALKTTIPESEARLITAVKDPTTDRLVITRAWPNIDAIYVDDLITASVSSVVDPEVDGQTYSGTYTVNTFKAEGQDDRSVVILQTMTSSVVNNQQRYVKRSCSETVQRTYYFGVSTIPSISSSSEDGTQHVLGGVSKNSDETYNAYSDEIIAISQSKDIEAIAISSDYLEDQYLRKNITGTELTSFLADNKFLTQEEGVSKSLQVSINDDCTFNVVGKTLEADTDGGELDPDIGQSKAVKNNLMLYWLKTEAEATAILAALSAQTDRVTKTVEVRRRDGGLYDLQVRQLTSYELTQTADFGAGETALNLYAGINSKTAPTVAIGVGERVQAQINPNEDNTFNYNITKLSEVTEQEATIGDANGQIISGKNKTSLPEVPTDMRLTGGINQIGPNGEYNYGLNFSPNKNTTKEDIGLGTSLVTKTLKVGRNTEAADIPVPTISVGNSADGNVSPGDDGKFNFTIAEVATTEGSQDAKTIGAINRTVEIDSARFATTLPTPVAEAGKTVSMRVNINDNGTFDWNTVTETFVADDVSSTQYSKFGSMTITTQLDRYINQTAAPTTDAATDGQRVTIRGLVVTDQGRYNYEKMTVNVVAPTGSYTIRSAKIIQRRNYPLKSVIKESSPNKTLYTYGKAEKRRVSTSVSRAYALTQPSASTASDDQDIQVRQINQFLWATDTATIKYDAWGADVEYSGSNANGLYRTVQSF